MYERNICRVCDSQTFGYTQNNSGQRSFVIPGADSHYAPDRPFRLTHIALDLKADPRAKTLSGTVTQKIVVVAPQQRVLKLDQVGLQIEEVLVNREKADFSVESQRLNIHLGVERQPGESFEVSIKYRAPHPKRGIYFTGPDADHPTKPFQIWTQGQDEDSRHWFPTLDYPNQKATSEVIATVPKGFTAVSNGALISQTDAGENTRFHYQLSVPHVTYLISLVVGEFSSWSDHGPRGIPVQYFAEKGREEDGRRAFQNTPRMIEVFERKTGIPYPYEKYSQSAVQDFIFGGMENTSATTQTDLTLHDERAHLDFSSDPLVSHELAHQWFGDLVTCRDWSHGWLNEGFATFMERVWVESNPGPGGGHEEAKYYSYQDLKAYLADDQSRYRRPIVCNSYIEPIDLFDTHLYQKGGLVLNLIRYVIGDDGFWKSVRVYLERHRGQSVETLDLIRAIEDTTGINLRRLMDEWVFNAGYPEFEISYQWHEDRKMTEWVIEQKQTGGKPSVTKDGATTYLFHLPVDLELTHKDGNKTTHRIEIGEPRERIFLSSATQPVMVRFDPHHRIPKTLKFPRPKEMLLYQLKQDPDCMGRIEAARELLKLIDPDVVVALGECVVGDSFWGVQKEAAQVLGEIRSDSARNALITALDVEGKGNGSKFPKARRAIAMALGTYRDEKAATALKKVAQSDASYYVEADATFAWALTQTKSATAEEFLLAQLSKSSYRDVIRVAALGGLAELNGIGSGERSQTLQTLLKWTDRKQSVDSRGAAVRALGKVLKSANLTEKAKILDVLNQVADEDNFRLRTHLVGALEDSSCSDAIGILNKIQRLEVDGRVKRAARIASDHLALSGTAPESIQTLKGTIDKLEEDYRRFRSLVEEKMSRK